MPSIKGWRRYTLQAYNPSVHTSGMRIDIDKKAGKSLKKPENQEFPILLYRETDWNLQEFLKNQEDYHAWYIHDCIQLYHSVDTNTPSPLSLVTK